MSRQERRMRWRAPDECQSRITLLGSPHLANPRNDEHNTEVDDTLTPYRQNELAVVRERLETRNFDHVAVEIPRDHQTALDEQYEAVRDDLALDDEEGVPDGPADVRGEAVQIGFRLADALDHERVHAVDSRPPFPDVDADWAIDENPDAVPYSLPDFEEMVKAEERMIRDSTLVEVLREKNRGKHLQTLHAGNIAASLSSSDGEEYVGSKQVGHWYERNARMLENLRRVTEPGDETLFVVGASHVVPVEQLADAAPGTCPRSSLPLLAE